MKNTDDCVSIYLESGEKNGNTSRRKLQGGFYKKGGAYYITYIEEETSGMGNSRVILKVTENSVIMRRMGEFSTVITYKNGMETEFDYNTPFGKMSIKIRTTKIDNGLFEKGGRLRICYTLLTGDLSENVVSLLIEQRRDRV